MILYTDQEIANARRNATRFEWARREVRAVLEACSPFTDRSDDELWKLLTGQGVPRGIHVNADLGCPSCGRAVYEGFGNYPWIVSLDRPWKLECPSCGQVWPKNDFGAFHQSGLGTNGLFDAALADRSLLYNDEHPDPGDPLFGFAVDDGMGWIDDDGGPWWFIAYYSHYCTWTAIPRAVTDLTLAWLYTGERLYAHKAAVLLDRIADVYPDMNIEPFSDVGMYNSHGGSGKGRIQGCIWETQIAEDLARACDIVFDGIEGDDDLVSFLSAKARSHELANDKSSLQQIRQNLRDNLLREFIASCRDYRIRGNEGMTQTTMATAAAVLDDPRDTPLALDWLFEPGTHQEGGGGHIATTLIGQVDRDGVGNEAAPGYCFIWMNLFRRCALVLERCRQHRDYDLHRDFPRLRRMYAAPYQLTALDRYTPRIGDTGRTGDPGMASVDLDFCLDTFRRLGDPVFARLAHKLNGDRSEGLHTSLFDPDPESIQSEVSAAVEQEGSLELGSANLNGYGLAMFRTGVGDGRRAACLYYGRNSGHGHRDRLNFGLYYRGMDVLPDLGYPEYADGRWPKRAGWTVNTISHNTVTVNRRQQDPSWIGRCRLFAASEGIGVVEVSCAEVYPETRDYRRTLSMIDLSEGESYLVDFMRAVGGDDHVSSFHSGEGTVTTSGLDLTDQIKGTYAGPDIPFGDHFDGPPDGRYRGSGHSYLYEVGRQLQPQPGWWVDWELADTWGARIGDAPVHLRCHGLSESDEVALAWGDPPQNKPGNPRRLRYLLQHRAGSEVSTLFVGVVEPYSGDSPNLTSVERLDLGLDADDLTAAAVSVAAADGRVDRILSSDSADQMYDLGNGIRAAGRFVFNSRSPDGSASIFALAATRIDTPFGTLRVDASSYTATVVDFHRDEIGPAWIDVDGEMPSGTQLSGSQLRVLSGGPRDTCYPVERVAASPRRGLRVWVGDTSFIRGLQSEADYGSGFVFDFDVGDRLEVLTLVHVSIRAGEAVAIRSTSAWSWDAERKTGL